MILRLTNGAKTREAWNPNSPEFIDDWKPEEVELNVNSVRITYGDHIKVCLVNNELLELFWDPGYNDIEYEGVFYGDLDLEP